MWHYILVFFSYLILDVAYASYIIACAEKKPIVASNWSVVCYISSATGLAVFVTDYYSVIPMVMGGWIGSYVVIKRSQD